MQTTRDVESPGDEMEAGLGPRDLVEAVARHGTLVVSCGIAGLLAAAGCLLLLPSTYESKAKLLVRYLLERGGVDPEMKSQVQGTSYTASVINDEIEILTSWDLAGAVADQVGAQRILGNARKEGAGTEAARRIKDGLTVAPVRESNVICVSYRNRSAELSGEVLQKLIEKYFAMHLEIHRSVAAYEFVAQQTEEVRKNLQEIDSELNRLRAEGGIMVRSDGVESPASHKAESRAELVAAQAERAGQQARIQMMEAMLAGKMAVGDPSKGGKATAAMPNENDVADYEAILDRLAQLRKRNAELASKFTDDSGLVRASHREIEVLEAQRRGMVTKFPSLAAKIAKGENGSPVIDLDGERARLAQIEGRISILESNLALVEAQEERIPGIMGKIKDLERVRETEEEKYRYFKSSTENARLDGAINPSMMPNISVVQEASPPEKAPSAILKKLVFLLAIGGLGIGIGIALLIEFLFDRRIKSPEALERRLGLAPLMAIPCLETSASLEAADGNGLSTALHPYAQTLGSKLAWSLRNRKKSRPARIVGCTGVAKGAGVTSISTGLAKSLMDNGERVLLVDLAGAFQEASRGGRASLKGSRFENGNYSSEVLLENAPVWAPSKLQEAIERMAEGEDTWVLVDLPPMEETSPASHLATCCDCVLLVTDPTTAAPKRVKEDYDELSEKSESVYCIYNRKGMRIPVAVWAARNREANKPLWSLFADPARRTLPA